MTISGTVKRACAYVSVPNFVLGISSPTSLHSSPISADLETSLRERRASSVAAYGRNNLSYKRVAGSCNSYQHDIRRGPMDVWLSSFSASRGSVILWQAPVSGLIMHRLAPVREYWRRVHSIWSCCCQKLMAAVYGKSLTKLNPTACQWRFTIDCMDGDGIARLITCDKWEPHHWCSIRALLAWPTI